MIKAIILDCFGVLYVPSGEDFYRSHIPDYPEFRSQLLDLTAQADYGLISHEDLVKSVADLTGLDIKTAGGDLANLVRNQVLLDYSQQLRKKYKIGMLSNISMHTMDKFFDKAEREQLFDDVVISSEVGLIKPHPAVFELAARRLGVDTSEVVFIDDLPANCDGAIAAGMHAIVYSTFADAKRQLEILL